MKLAVSVAIAVALVAGLGIGPATAIPFPALADGFSIDLPRGWVQIPMEAINQAEEETARRAPNARQSHADYAFQLSSGDGWFKPPYVVIHVDRRGRVPESQLAKSDNFSTNNTKAKAQDALKDVASELDIGKMRYDSSSHMLWFKTASNVSGVGRVLGISAIIPTQYGHIDVSGYALERDYAGFTSAFNELVTSITPDASTRYQVSLEDYLPFLAGFKWESIITSALAMGILAAVGGLAWRRKK